MSSNTILVYYCVILVSHYFSYLIKFYHYQVICVYLNVSMVTDYLFYTLL